MASSADILSLMKHCNIRMVAMNRQAEIIALQLDASETPVDVVKAYRVLLEGKKFGNSSGFALVFLTNQRIIVACGGVVSLPLSEIASISDLVKGKFQWITASGETWAFEHAQGIIRSNGNRENTARFYEAMKAAVSTV